MMLVEIDLLPKKEHKKSSLLIMTLLILVIFSVSSSVIYFQGSSYENKMASIDHQIESIQKLNAVQQEKMEAGESGNSAIKLQEAVNWAEQYPLETVPLLRNIISQLPERGFIKNFEYSNTDSVIITIQFDASRDAAYYLSSLKQSQWVQEVNLLNVIAVTEEGTETAQTDGTNATDDEDTILPRYTADYELTFKPDEFKKDGTVASKGGDET
jgi:type IV pilus assembly protein PilN